mmetsp:Transcript_84242/g.239266  ORF Transcript_84242/g.239266 Transcript_84242/m.239266 type:complete len:304 (-) Transcript_84242:1741-2652(-)
MRDLKQQVFGSMSEPEEWVGHRKRGQGLNEVRTVSQWKELEGQRREEQFKAAAAMQAARRAVDKAANEAAMHEASDRIGVAPGGGADVERKERLLAAFQSYDTNGDGFISAAELGSIETTLSFSDSHVGDLIREIDVDGDGRIDFEEFVEIVTALEDKRASNSAGGSGAEEGQGGTNEAESHRSWRPAVFSNLQGVTGVARPDWDLSMVDAALRSSAAPTFFPTYQGEFNRNKTEPFVHFDQLGQLGQLLRTEFHPTQSPQATATARSPRTTLALWPSRKRSRTTPTCTERTSGYCRSAPVVV